MVRVKPVIVGLNNPYSDNPDHALRPHPINSSGYRLARMFLDAAEKRGLDMNFLNYERGFRRFNFFEKTLDMSEGERAGQLLKEFQGRDVVCCGNQVVKLLGLSKHSWTLWSKSQGLRYCVIPHPSGLTRNYNEPWFRSQVGELLLNLYLESRA